MTNTTKRGHTCPHQQAGSQQQCMCGAESKRRAGGRATENGTDNSSTDGSDALPSFVVKTNGQEQPPQQPTSNGNGPLPSLLGGESLLSLVSAAEHHSRQAQERGEAYNNGNDYSSSSSSQQHQFPSLSASSPAVLTSRVSYPPSERLIAFTTASREYPHLRPVPVHELANLRLFRQWVRREFDLKDDAFALVDRSLEAKNSPEGGLIDSDEKLAMAKDVEIVDSPQADDADKSHEPHDSILQQPPSAPATSPEHQDLFNYAKSILLFLSDKGHGEARNIIAACPSTFQIHLAVPTPSSNTNVPVTSLNGSSNDISNGSTMTPMPTSPVMHPASSLSAPALPRIIAQAPPCLIPGYYIFSPVFDASGEKRKLPIRIEIPRSVAFDGERYRTVSTYIGLGPFGNDPCAFVRLEGDHLVGTVASRVEEDEDYAGIGTGAEPTMCTFVFKNLRLKTRSLIRTVLDVAYGGMRTGRFFFMVDDEVLPTASRRFEIKAPSGYTIKMVNKSARSNPVAKHPSSPPSTTTLSPPHSPPLSRSLSIPAPTIDHIININNNNNNHVISSSNGNGNSNPLSHSLNSLHNAHMNGSSSNGLFSSSPSSSSFSLPCPTPTHTPVQLNGHVLQEIFANGHPSRIHHNHKAVTKLQPSMPQLALSPHAQPHTQTQLLRASPIVPRPATAPAITTTPITPVAVATNMPTSIVYHHHHHQLQHINLHAVAESVAAANGATTTTTATTATTTGVNANGNASPSINGLRLSSSSMLAMSM